MDKLPNKSNIKRLSTISDAPKASIEVLIKTMEDKIEFSKLILYSLNTLKSYLIIQNTYTVYDNSLIILNSKIN